MTTRGKFITFDGIDGAGKTTQINLLAEKLRQQGKTVYITREPGGTELSEKIRGLLLCSNNKMSPITELLLVFAARAEHVETVLRPKVVKGEWIICSRFSDATMAYQGYGRDLDLEKVKIIANVVHSDFNPDLSLFLDLSAEIAAKRRIKRGEASDRFEDENISFMKKVRNGYLDIAQKDPKRCKLIDATDTVDKMAENIWQAVQSL